MTTLVTFVPAATSVRAAAAELCSWLTFTASVLFTPAATLVIWLPPLFRPAVVRLTDLLALVGLVMVIPALLMVVLPVFTLPVSVRSRFLFRLT